MPKYRYWLLEDEEDEEDPCVMAEGPGHAAELAAHEIIKDGDGDEVDSLRIAVRDVEGGQAKMFDVYVDWSPTCTPYYCGALPEHEDEQSNET